MADNISLIWIDLETTGLSAQDDVPLEVGLKLTDKDGFVFAERKWLVNEEGAWFKRCIERAKYNEFVGPMHEKSGLWDALDDDEFPGQPRYEVDQQMCEFLDEHEVTFGALGLAGSSIGSLDRPFCLIHFPKFNLQAGYRNIDISSIKELCKRLNPGLFVNLSAFLGSKEDAKHRVLEDIDASILEYRAYVENFLIVED